MKLPTSNVIIGHVRNGQLDDRLHVNAGKISTILRPDYPNSLSIRQSFIDSLAESQATALYEEIVLAVINTKFNDKQLVQIVKETNDTYMCGIVGDYIQDRYYNLSPFAELLRDTNPHLFPEELQLCHPHQAQQFIDTNAMCAVNTLKSLFRY